MGIGEFLRKYGNRLMAAKVIALSMSYHRESLLARGMGYDHLRELLIRLARPIVRQGASLAYGGNWRQTAENFTFELLRLISSEQEEKRLGGPDTSLTFGRLYNHSSWPNYLAVTPKIEAQWANNCRIIRVTPQLAGFAGDEIVSDDDAAWKLKCQDPRAVFNAAATLSAMRRLMMRTTDIQVPDVPVTEQVPAVAARILLGGGVERYSGFVPGIFEEALVTLESNRPAYLLGGFGGAAGILADAIVQSGSDRPPQLTVEWNTAHCQRLNDLLESSAQFKPPAGLRATATLLDDLFGFVLKARQSPSATLRTGLSDDETRELLGTRDISTAVRLVRQGLQKTMGLGLRALPRLPG